ncbi:MAG: peptide chain release factor N(5)-glutamine methyltransferase [Gammaproteobacteria bacterium]
MTQTIASVLQDAYQQLLMTSESPHLDAEVLLAHVLQEPRSHLFAFPERELTDDVVIFFKKRIEERHQKIPIAYITGHQEFWSLDLRVTKDTLIPRPETELLVELVLKWVAGKNQIIADLGTGSGAIALALAHEQPTWTLHATDISASALQVAKLNAERLHLSNVIFHQGSWCEPLPKINYAAIVSNPPYIASGDLFLEQGDLVREPESALIADENGLGDLRRIIIQSREYLCSNGYLLLEHGFQQASDVRKIFAEWGYNDVNSYQDLAGLDRVTYGKIKSC